MLDLRKYPFPTVSSADLAFPIGDVPADLLAEAKERGFYEHYNPYNQLFSTLFFEGGKLEFKKSFTDADAEFVRTATAFLRKTMGSWDSKHEHKAAVCALLLSELVDLPEKK